jgi:hypothetical protein
MRFFRHFKKLRADQGAFIGLLLGMQQKTRGSTQPGATAEAN